MKKTHQKAGPEKETDAMPRRRLSFLDRSKLVFADLIKGITEFCRRDVVRHPWRAYFYLPFLGIGALTPLFPGPNLPGALMFCGLYAGVKTLKFFRLSKWAERLDARIQESFDEQKLLRRYGAFLKPAGNENAPEKITVQDKDLAVHVLVSAKNNFEQTAPPWGQWIIRNVAAPVIRPAIGGLSALYNKAAGLFAAGKKDVQGGKPPAPRAP